MRFISNGTNPDFFLFVADLNTFNQQLVINGARLNSGDTNGISVRLTPDGSGNCRARWTVQTDAGDQFTGEAAESASEPGGETVEVHL